MGNISSKIFDSYYEISTVKDKHFHTKVNALVAYFDGLFSTCLPEYNLTIDQLKYICITYKISPESLYKFLNHYCKVKGHNLEICEKGGDHGA